MERVVRVMNSRYHVRVMTCHPSSLTLGTPTYGDPHLTLSTCGPLLVLGGNPLNGSDTLDSRMGASLWDLSLGQCTGDGQV